jgi:hypothetical protein
VQKKLYRALIDFHAQNGTLEAQTILKAMPWKGANTSQSLIDTS